MTNSPDPTRFYDVPRPTLILLGGPDHGRRIQCPYDPPPRRWHMPVVRGLSVLTIASFTLEESAEFMRRPNVSDYVQALDAAGWPSRTDDGAWRYAYQAS